MQGFFSSCTSQLHKKLLIAAGLAKGEEVNATEKNILIEGSGGAAGEGGSLRKMALYKRWRERNQESQTRSKLLSS